jgi:precorrin-4 methylase
MRNVTAGTVYIVGVGPGDPELMTIRAKNIIDAADLIIYTGSLLGADGFKDVKPTATLVDSAGLHLRGTLGDIGGQVKAAKMRAQALIMVGPVFREDLRQTWAKKSKLYDAEFSHTFRRGTPGRLAGTEEDGA